MPTCPPPPETSEPAPRAHCSTHCAYVTDTGLCDWCAGNTRTALASLPDRWRQLHDLGDMPGCGTSHVRPARDEDGQLILDDLGQRVHVEMPCDCAPQTSGALLPGQATGDKVSGTGERSLGVRVAVLSFVGPHTNDARPMRLDLGGCKHTGYTTTCGHCPAPDPRLPELQVGHLPLVDTLAELARTTAAIRGLALAAGFPADTWESTLPAAVWSGARYLQQARAARSLEPLPRADVLVEALVGFLLIHHEHNASQDGCDDYAHEVRAAARYAEQLLGMTDAPVELKPGVPCPAPACGYMTLVQAPGGDVECARASCSAVLRPAEYEKWVKDYAGRKRTVRRKHGALPEETPTLQATRLRDTAAELGASPKTRRIAAGLLRRADEIDAGA